jgi:hypothetical protein
MIALFTLNRGHAAIDPSAVQTARAVVRVEIVRDAPVNLLFAHCARRELCSGADVFASLLLVAARLSQRASVLGFLLSPKLAAAAMSLSAVSVIASALRLRRVKPDPQRASAGSGLGARPSHGSDDDRLGGRKREAGRRAARSAVVVSDGQTLADGTMASAKVAGAVRMAMGCPGPAHS